MAPTPYFSRVTSESAFRARFEAENGRNFSDLPHVAASSWGRSHLLACRVVRREPLRSILPILSPYIVPSDWQPSSSNEIDAFLQGPDSTLMAQSEHYLVRGSHCGPSLGQVWAAMAMFKGSQGRRRQGISDLQMEGEGGDDSDSDSDSDTEIRSKRPRRGTYQGEFVDSSTIQVGSSSPVHDSSQGSSSVGYTDPESHTFGVAPEDETLRLASCVIRHILYFAPPQDSVLEPTVVEFRDAKMIAIDDGGLCLRRQEPGKGFLVVKDHVALLEAKTQFQCLKNGRPIISDKCFAQMFDISGEYVEEFEKSTRTHFLHVSCTPWFDLSQRSGREHVVANICGIVRRATS
ncbi:uncharacterized protein BO80DRAFT_492520 [Aspergillus ibericus CBS 121593]|uniref:Uncharacterized protein n=1 Tax=Aspergillus ibericus CBS 121593 TaxID=1448316 RepID=A0A395H413_9EURO|nr:hypothetical protein BO80DRAFT_492520 [Aspergillus ibericus CBS 121593]RAL02363.1 hypothetical protein BO80DRAFT_492520 [Aspergillus ibericus CBS 121593]